MKISTDIDHTTGRVQVHQCKSCPWRVGCEPDKDIPRYNLRLAQGLSDTIADTPEQSLATYLSGTVPTMACHYSEPGQEFACAGWLHHQLGVGNNIAVRLGIISGKYPVPVVDGEQHERYEDTLPAPAPKRRRARGRR